MTGLGGMLGSNPTLAAFLESRPVCRTLAETLVENGLGGSLAKALDGAREAAMEAFFDDLARLDLAWVRAHRAALLDGAPQATLAAADLVPVEPGTIGDRDRGPLDAAGRESLARGEWAAIVFAGGAATRFYTEARTDPRVAALAAAYGDVPPKALFPLTPVAGRPFLEHFAAEALAAGIAAGRMPFVVPMTSRLTEGPIRAHVASASMQGFPKDMMPVLPQTEQPRLDAEGDLLAGEDGRLVVTGDGHGGVYKALLATGPDGRSLADRLRVAGVRGVVLHNVDNAASRPFEAGRIGWHISGGYAMTLTVVPRARISEKVGLVMRDRRADRIEVVEYSVCPREVAEAAATDGGPLFRLAHINTNLVALDAVRGDIPPTLYTGKKVEVAGRVVDTSSFEMLNQHLSGLLPAARVGVLAAERDGYFMPTKSLRGEDSLEDTMAAMSRLAARRLRALGAEVDETAVVEIDPCLPDDGTLRALGAGQGWRLGPGSRLFLGVRHGGGGPAVGPGLVLEAGATLVASAALPYGTPRFDAATRAVAEDPATASFARVGRDVTVEAGGMVAVRADAGGRAIVPDGARLRSIELRAGPGETVTA